VVVLNILLRLARFFADPSSMDFVQGSSRRPSAMRFSVKTLLMMSFVMVWTPFILAMLTAEQRDW
jgi:hypothetical protein